MAVIVDETVLLRYLLDDDPEQSVRAAALMAGRDVYVYGETLARTAITLTRLYGATRREVARAFTDLMSDVMVDEPTVCELACRLYGDTHLDFTDCLLVARAGIYGDEVMSYGKPVIEGFIDYRVDHSDR